MTQQKLVVVKGSGGAGLGDRMCGLAVGILYAQHTGRALHVDWRDRAFESQHQNLFPELIRVMGVPMVDSIPATSSVAPDVWCNHLDLGIDQVRAIDLENRGIKWTGAAPAWDPEEALRRYSVDVANYDYPENVVVIWSGASMNSLVEKLKQDALIDATMTADEMLGHVIGGKIRLRNEIDDRIEGFRREIIGDRPTLGIHYRKTDEAAAVRTIPTESQYLKETDRALATLPDDAAMFLATDNADVQSVYQNRYGAKRVCWTDKWLPKSGRSIHKNDDCPDGLMAAKDALLDVGLLARCDRLVLTGNSSFSSLAGWFSESPATHRQLVFPKGGSAPRRIFRALKRFSIG